MIGTIIFFGVLVGAVTAMALGCSQLGNTPYQRERELEEIKRDQRTFWTSHIN